MLSLIYIYFLYFKECFFAILQNTNNTFHPGGSGVEFGNYAFFSTILTNLDEDQLEPEFLTFNYRVEFLESELYGTDLYLEETKLQSLDYLMPIQND
jgi:hypothetical protein